ncbi:antitoxin VbhA family protein [Brevibacterium atlanticum]|uniref:antitoxin VbhA family protein n=1 Tax=Brevibacterium atlanticum TaxID=2697563 RepID=UPI0038992012
MNLEARWPEIFEGMTSRQIHTVSEIVASSWHEGREPEREHTARLAARVRGDLSKAEYRRLEGLPPTNT